MRDDLIERFVEVLSADQRVRAAWLGGSVGRGGGDEFSDLDFTIVVNDWDAYVEKWDTTVAKIADVVLRQSINGPRAVVYVHVTADWQRFDTVIVESAEIPDSGIRLLVDRGGLSTSAPEENEPATPERVAATAREFLRVLGLLPLVIGREEYVVGSSGAGLLRAMLVQTTWEDVRGRGGTLRLRGVVPDERLAVLEALPPIVAERDAVIEAHIACARAFLPLARELAGDAWPTRLEEACRSHLRTSLQIEF